MSAPACPWCRTDDRVSRQPQFGRNVSSRPGHLAWGCEKCARVFGALEKCQQRGTFPGDMDVMPSGHTRHCEARQRWGDGECECGASKGRVW